MYASDKMHIVAGISPGWRFRSKGPQKTDDYFGVKPPKKDPIIGAVVQKAKTFQQID